MRTFFGLAGGTVAGLLIQAIVVYLASFAIDMPALDSTARAEIAQAFADSPAPALLASMLSYGLAGLGAAWIGAAVSGKAWVAWTAGGLVALLALAIAIVFPEPAWAQFGAFIAAVAGTMIGKHLGARRGAAADGAAADAAL